MPAVAVPGWTRSQSNDYEASLIRLSIGPSLADLGRGTVPGGLGYEQELGSKQNCFTLYPPMVTKFPAPSTQINHLHASWHSARIMGRIHIRRSLLKVQAATRNRGFGRLASHTNQADYRGLT